MFAVDEATLQRFYGIVKIIDDIDGDLAPEIVPASVELDYEHGLFLHPSPLRTIAIWMYHDVWMFRYLELNIADGTVYRVGDPQTLAPLGHPQLAETVARMLARAGRDLVSSIADRIIVPRETVSDVFDAHLAGAARMAFCARAWLTRNGFAAEW